jgi:hypothetical protein
MPAGSKQPVVVHYIEHCPPDVGAAFIWLKNRDPDRWRDVQNVEHVLGKYIISDRPMTAEQWAAERATVVNDVVEELPAPSDATYVRLGSIFGTVCASFAELSACLPCSLKVSSDNRSITDEARSYIR